MRVDGETLKLGDGCLYHPGDGTVWRLPREVAAAIKHLADEHVAAIAGAAAAELRARGVEVPGPTSGPASADVGLEPR